MIPFKFQVGAILSLGCLGVVQSFQSSALWLWECDRWWYYCSSHEQFHKIQWVTWGSMLDTRYCLITTRHEFWLTFLDPYRISSGLDPWWRLNVSCVKITEHPCFVNPSSDACSSSSRKIYAGKQKGPIYSRPIPIADSLQRVWYLFRIYIYGDVL